MIRKALKKVTDGKDLPESEMEAVMSQIMNGEVEPALLGAFLTGLRMKGESTQEIAGAAKVMREKAEKVLVSVEKVLDTCGTGGDGADTFNISTASAFVAAGAGVTVAKHGNKAVSSRSGSADVLAKLGVNVQASKATVEKCIQEVGIGFLFAPLLHPAMKNAVAVRKALGIRTIFNVLGPLTNPAGAQYQVIGVYDPRWLVPFAEVLKDLGSKRAFIVHGHDGLDEIALTSKTHVTELNDGQISNYDIEPERFGLEKCRLDDLKGGDPETNAQLILRLLDGEKGPKRNVVLLNAAAGIAAVKGSSLEEGFKEAEKSIDSGSAKKKLEFLIEMSAE
jgi:anthranilate phosphoribosyltransferase